MKRLILYIVILIIAATNKELNAQYKLTNDSIVTINDLQYGYTITNKQSKEDYERYEIRFFITNQGWTKDVLRSSNNTFNLTNSNNSSTNNQNAIAVFNCINATGKRLTNKSKSLFATNWNLTITEAMSKELAGKTIQAAYIFRSGNTISGTEVMLTPKGELPIVQVNPVQIREMN